MSATVQATSSTYRDGPPVTETGGFITKYSRIALKDAQETPLGDNIMTESTPINRVTIDTAPLKDYIYWLIDGHKNGIIDDKTLASMMEVFKADAGRYVLKTVART
jgi:hypothetical protein